LEALQAFFYLEEAWRPHGDCSDILDITFKVLLKLMYVSTIYCQFKKKYIINIYNTSKKFQIILI